MQVECPLKPRELRYFCERGIRICVCNVPEGSWRHKPKPERGSEHTMREWERLHHEFRPSPQSEQEA